MHAIDLQCSRATPRVFYCSITSERDFWCSRILQETYDAEALEARDFYLFL